MIYCTLCGMSISGLNGFQEHRSKSCPWKHDRTFANNERWVLSKPWKILTDYCKLNSTNCWSINVLHEPDARCSPKSCIRTANQKLKVQGTWYFWNLLESKSRQARFSRDVRSYHWVHCWLLASLSDVGDTTRICEDFLLLFPSDTVDRCEACLPAFDLDLVPFLRWSYLRRLHMLLPILDAVTTCF